jgi:hypothetical protein
MIFAHWLELEKQNKLPSTEFLLYDWSMFSSADLSLAEGKRIDLSRAASSI